MLGTLVALALLAPPADLSDLQPLCDSTFRSRSGVMLADLAPSFEEIQRIADAGFSVVRVPMSWASIEKEKGKYTFAMHDPIVEMCNKRRLRVLFVLFGAHPLYGGNLSGDNAAASPGFLSFAYEVAQHYRNKAVMYELGNEPDLDQSFGDGPKGFQYFALNRIAAERIFLADQGARILGPGVSEIDKEFLERGLSFDLLKIFDGISVHQRLALAPEGIIAPYQALAKEFAEKNGGKPAPPIVTSQGGMLSAAGAKAASMRDQAALAVRFFLCASLAESPLTIWGRWRDAAPKPAPAPQKPPKMQGKGGGPARGPAAQPGRGPAAQTPPAAAAAAPAAPATIFGLVDANGAPKPALQALQYMHKMLGDYAFGGRLTTKEQGDYILLFKKGKSLRFVAWTTGEPRLVPLLLPATKLVATDMFGNNEADVGEKLKLDGAPMFIKAKGED